jgi:thioredoxin-like negative regulator of GroEL
MEGIFNLDELSERIRIEHGLLLYFSNDSCSVCKVLKPHVSQMLQIQFPKLRAYYIDIDKSPLLSGQHQVFTIPTILIYFQGKEYARLSRHIGLHQVEEAIRKPYDLIFGN